LILAIYDIILEYGVLLTDEQTALLYQYHALHSLQCGQD